MFPLAFMGTGTGMISEIYNLLREKGLLDFLSRAGLISSILSFGTFCLY